MFATCLAGERASGLKQTAAETIDQPLHSLFHTNLASDSILTSFKVNGNVPDRRTWNLDQAQERLNATSPKKVSFGLKTVENRDWRLAKSDAKKRAKGVDPLAPEPPPISEARASLNVSKSAPSFSSSAGLQEETERPLKRADKYYQALLKADKARCEYYRREEWEEFLAKAGKAAEKAKKKALKAEKKAQEGGRSDSEEDEEADAEEEEDPGPLQPYPGVMKVEVEVVVLRAPGAEKSETESSVDQNSTHTPSSASEKSDNDDDGIDWSKELQALQEEFAEPEKDAESETDSLPDGLFGRVIGNVHDNLQKRTALGLGGTAFFVPEVERYAFQPSLLPPPPRGEGHLQQTGHKRLKLKPRLPLEVSKHRWRDEHPYGCPVENEFTPDWGDYHAFEEQVRRVELYGTLSKIMTAMPKPDGIRKIPKTDMFERTLDFQLKDSIAWKQYIKRQRLLELARSSKGSKTTDAQDLLEGYKPGLPSGKGSAPDADNDPASAISPSGRPETGAYAKHPPSVPVLDATRGDYLCTPPDRGKRCEECEGKGFWHDHSSGMSHDKEPWEKCLFCKRCKACSGRGKHKPPKDKELKKYPSVPPLKMPGPPAFEVGKPVQRSPSPRKSPQRSGLMSVAGEVRKGAH